MKLISGNIENSLTYSIVGLPESGVTLIGKVMDSIEGSMCMIDPIKNIHSVNMDMSKNITTREIKMIDRETNNLIDGYQRFIKTKSKFKIGGIKEDYSPIPTIINKEINKVLTKSDFLIFVIGDPKSNFSKWKISRFTKDGKLNPNYRLNHDMYIKMYKNYINKYHDLKMVKPTFLIKFEEFCENPSSNFLNNIFKGSLEFEGDIDENIRIPRIPLRNNCINLITKEIKEIDSELEDIYENVRGYGYY